MSKPLKIVVPMAGFGTRLRPLTWNKPKPLVSLAGGTILDHVLKMFTTVPDFHSAEFVFILGPTMGDQIKAHVAKHYPDWHVDYAIQPEMKGQSDAFWHAREYLHGPLLITFSDTLIENNFSFLDKEEMDAVAWVKAVPDPRRFGVAEADLNGKVTRLVEKPKDLHNNLAVVGCYYFKEAEDLISAIEEQVRLNISLKGEFYLVDAINIMLDRGLMMRTELVDTWLDAGTMEALLDTNQYLLEHGRDNSQNLSHLDDSIIIPPVNIHPEARVSKSILGPNLSVGAGAVIHNCVLQDSIIGDGAHITSSILEGSLLGNNVTVNGQSGKVNLGDDSWIAR
ncbi:MAG: sugar phosphate nucleotidyltransferase [Brevefilum sp.]|jgi:glucose-1-phosphate thymidylyltransferase